MNHNGHTYWLDKPYYSLNAYFKHTFGQKIYKIAVDAGLTCPNRDGAIDCRGCVFCSAGGSGDFAVPIGVRPYEHRSVDSNSPYGIMYDRQNIDTNAIRTVSVKRQIERGIAKFNKRVGERFVVYFQAYTGTYGDREYLRNIWSMALEEENVVGISIATRPDCLGLGNEPWQERCQGILDVIEDIRSRYEPAGKFIWIELGLQTIHRETADYIRRGYDLSIYDEAVRELAKRNIPYITHIILGLPHEDREMQLETVRYVCNAENRPFGVKLQLLHILKGTDMADAYAGGQLCVMDMDEYIDFVIDALLIIPDDIVIHRVTGDGPKNILVAPEWSANKRMVLNTFHRRMRERGAYQGSLC